MSRSFNRRYGGPCNVGDCRVVRDYHTFDRAGHEWRERRTCPECGFHAGYHADDCNSMGRTTPMTKPKRPTIDDILAYEGGEMGEEETITFFQALVDTGLAWTLQGHYGRTAASMIDAGILSDPSDKARNTAARLEFAESRNG